MAESTENSIPNQKKNNQKNVVIVPNHVHDHDSQVSQIFDPDIASDITQAQQKDLEGKKKRQLSVCESTEPGKKIYLQPTSDSPSVVHHQDDEILQADDNINKSHEFVGLPCQDMKAIRKKNAS
ncbi:hypothetical protein TNCV_316521 [Trichonephila clavipes]|nr:hypothetical protein TNCV_316521 [Trichonephila clavipes]